MAFTNDYRSFGDILDEREKRTTRPETGFAGANAPVTAATAPNAIGAVGGLLGEAERGTVHEPNYTGSVVQDLAGAISQQGENLGDNAFKVTGPEQSWFGIQGQQGGVNPLDIQTQAYTTSGQLLDAAGNAGNVDFSGYTPLNYSDLDQSLGEQRQWGQQAAGALDRMGSAGPAINQAADAQYGQGNAINQTAAEQKAALDPLTGYANASAGIGGDIQGLAGNQQNIVNSMGVNRKAVSDIAGQVSQMGSRQAEALEGTRAYEQQQAKVGDTQQALAGDQIAAANRMGQDIQGQRNMATATMGQGTQQAGNAQTMQGVAGQQLGAAQGIAQQNQLFDAAARGQAPSQAAIQQQQGLDQAARSQLALAATGRGPQAGYQAQQGIANLQRSAISDAAALRAQEMANARQQLLGAQQNNVSALQAAQAGYGASGEQMGAAGQTFGNAGQQWGNAAQMGATQSGALGAASGTLANSVAGYTAAGQTAGQRAANYGDSAGTMAAAGDLHQGAANIGSQQISGLTQTGQTMQAAGSQFGQAADIMAQQSAGLGAVAGTQAAAGNQYAGAGNQAVNYADVMGRQAQGYQAGQAGESQIANQVMQKMQMGMTFEQAQYETQMEMQKLAQDDRNALLGFAQGQEQVGLDAFNADLAERVARGQLAAEGEKTRVGSELEMAGIIAGESAAERADRLNLLSSFIGGGASVIGSGISAFGG
jgi:hypothetical protein